MRKALITGITGQDGAYLAKHLITRGYHVYGLVRGQRATNLRNLEYLGVDKWVERVWGDIADAQQVEQIIKQIKPDECYNLAAQSFVGVSWAFPYLTTDVNALGVLNLLEAIKRWSPDTKFYQASTSEMFGNAKSSVQNEDTPMKPRSPYGVSKLYAHEMTRLYRESYNLFTSCGILFNHESPLRGEDFVTRKISQGVARVALHQASNITLGTLDSRRDWGHANDYTLAMYNMLQHNKADDFVVATGTTHSIRDFLDIAFAYIGIDDWEPLVLEDPQLRRPAELYSLCGDAAKARQELDWRPITSFQAIVHEMVQADMDRLKND